MIRHDEYYSMGYFFGLYFGSIGQAFDAGKEHQAVYYKHKAGDFFFVPVEGRADTPYHAEQAFREMGFKDPSDYERRVLTENKDIHLVNYAGR